MLPIKIISCDLATKTVLNLTLVLIINSNRKTRDNKITMRRRDGKMLRKGG